MDNELSYTEAFKKLQKLVLELEKGNVALDKLSDKIAQANEWIKICEEKLRGIENELTFDTFKK